MIKDIPIFIDDEEIVERPQFEDEEEFFTYLQKISEDRDICMVLEHPHDDECMIIEVHIGEGLPNRKCPVKGCKIMEEE
jgi:hypothetical protein